MNTAWWRNQLNIAIIGALALGIFGAAVAMQQVPAVAGVQTARQQGQVATTLVATPTHRPKIQPTRTATDIPTRTPTGLPTGTPISTPTHVPTQPASQTVTLMGKVTTIDTTNQQFGFQPDAGGALTVHTNSTTRFGGSLNAFGDLRTGMRVQVIGVQQPDGSLLATSVTYRQDD